MTKCKHLAATLLDTPFHSLLRPLTMKIALFLTAVAGASAFAPVQQPARLDSQLKAAELEGMRGVGPETAGKIVSR